MSGTTFPFVEANASVPLQIGAPIPPGSTASGNVEDKQPAEGVKLRFARVYVSNISFHSRIHRIREFFSTVAPVLWVEPIMNSARQWRGAVVVEYHTVQDAAKAIEALNGKTLDGRALFVREDRDGPSQTSTTATTARQRLTAGPRHAVCSAGNPPPETSADVSPVSCQVRSGNTVRETGCRVYVGNINYSTDWRRLKAHFMQVGIVEFCDVFVDSVSGRPLGCGIVKFTTPQDAAKAIETLHNSVLDGRPILVREDREDVSLARNQLTRHESATGMNPSLDPSFPLQPLHSPDKRSRAAVPIAPPNSKRTGDELAQSGSAPSQSGSFCWNPYK